MRRRFRERDEGCVRAVRARDALRVRVADPRGRETKVTGLRDYYGIVGDAAEYFQLHGELDVEHSRELAAAIAEVATTDEDRAEAEAGAKAGAAAIYGLLDGVARVRNISCN